MIISPEYNKTTKDNKTKLDIDNNQNEKELLRPQTQIIQDHIKEKRNDRKREANTTSPIPNQSPEKKMILPTQSTAIQIDTNNETDV